MEPNPSIVLFSQDLKMPPHIVMELCCIVGALLGLLVMVSRVFRTADIFVLLWALYLSVYKVRDGTNAKKDRQLALAFVSKVLALVHSLVNYSSWKYSISKVYVYLVTVQSHVYDIMIL